jgi:hypothetical protein
MPRAISRPLQGGGFCAGIIQGGGFCAGIIQGGGFCAGIKTPAITAALPR